MTSYTCPRCAAVLGQREIEEGWCESCGQQLPEALLASARKELKKAGGASREKPRPLRIAPEQTRPAARQVEGLGPGEGGLISAPVSQLGASAPPVTRTRAASGRSLLIGTVACAHLLLGGLFVAFGLYCFVAGADAVAKLLGTRQEVTRTGDAAKLSQENAQLVNGTADSVATGLSAVILALVTVVAVVCFLQGVPLLLAGYGVWRRRRWGRILALGLAVLGGLEGLTCLFAVGQSTTVLLTGLALLGYAVLTCVVLLARRQASEFAGNGRTPGFAEEQPRDSSHPEPPGLDMSPTEVLTSDPEAGTPGRQLPSSPAQPALPRAPARIPVVVAVLATLLGTMTLATATFAILYFRSGMPAEEPRSAHEGDRGTGKGTVAAGGNKGQAQYQERLASFLDAAEKGQVSRTMELAQSGVAVDDKDEQGQTALMRAAGQGHLDMCLLLLAFGAQINETDRQGQTALMQAAENGHGTVVDLLLGKTVDTTTIDAYRAQLRLAQARSLADKASADGKLPQLDLRGLQLEPFKIQPVEVDARDQAGQTAFIKAAVNGHHGVAKALLLKGARGTTLDNEGNNLWLLAAAKGDLSAFPRLPEEGTSVSYKPDGVKNESTVVLGTPAEMVNYLGMEDWMLAAAGGHLEAMQFLLGPNPPKEKLAKKNKKGKTALELAAANGHQEVVDYLRPLMGIAEPVAVAPKEGGNEHVKKEPTPLMRAVQADDVETVQRLLKASPDLKDCDKQGRTVLLQAAARGNADIVLLLCAHAGKSPDLHLDGRDTEGKTALIYAAAGGHTAAVDGLLIALTAAWHRGQINWYTYLDQRDNAGKMALEQAQEKGHRAVVDLLQGYIKVNLNSRRGSDTRTALEEASMRGDSRSAAGLLKEGASRDRLDENNLTALMFASQEGHILVVRALLASFGSDKVARKDYVSLRLVGPHPSVGGTALTRAAMNNHILVVQALLDAFGDDRQERKLYLEVGQPTLNTATGSYAPQTALALAEAKSYTEIVALLRRYMAE